MERLKNAALRILILFSVPLTLLVVPELIHAPSEPGWLGQAVNLTLRPLVTIDHALCIAAIALLAGQNKQPPLAGAITALYGGLIAGYIAIQLVPGFPFEGLVPLALALACGLLVAAAPAIRASFLIPAIAAVGAAVGFNTYPEDATVPLLLATLAGLLLGAALLFGLVVWLASRTNRDWQRAGVRIAGSWIAAIAGLILALALKAMGLVG